MKRLFPFLLLTFGCVSIAVAQEKAPASVPIAARTPADGPFLPEPAIPGDIVLPLYPPDSSLLNHARIHEAERYNTSGKTSDKLKNTINIHNPSIEVHLPPAGAPKTGAAIIVAPGGGHKILWIGPEGYETAPFFDQYGVATIVLRNRLRVDGYEPTVDAVNDAFQAIRLVRSHAVEWKLDPSKIGIIGFSAGGELSAPAALFFDDFAKKNAAPTDSLAKVSARPDFVGLIYPGPSPFNRDTATPIPANVPPSFVVCAGSGDQVHAVWADEYFSAMLKAGVPNVEMHIYGRGKHGGAIGPRDGIPFGTWQDRFIEWFRDLGFLEPPGTETKAAQESAAYAKKQTK